MVGYSYAHRYKERFGYRFCAELTVYLKEGFGKKRLGTRLYSAVIELLGLMGYRNLYGIVTDPNPAASRCISRSASARPDASISPV